MHWLSSASRFACAPVVGLPAPCVWPVCKSYPPTEQKKICRFMPSPPGAGRCAASINRAIIFNCGPRLLDVKVAPFVGTVTVPGNGTVQFQGPFGGGAVAVIAP